MNPKALKDISFFILSAILLVMFSGCSAGGKDKSAAGDNKLTIVTSFYPMYVQTINIARDIPGVEVVNMTEPQTGCLHDYPLTTDDMKLLENARIFVINGAGMEAFMEKVTGQMKDLKIVEAAKGIPLIEEEGEGNPHVWVSISMAIQQVNNITEQLAAFDPYHADRYKANGEAYVRKLEDLKTKMHTALDSLKSRNIVTFHEAFPYFAKEFNLNIKAVIEREPGTEPSAQELADTVKIIKDTGIRALFAEPQYSAKAADTIALETGARVYSLDPVVTGEANGDYDAYIRAMENNMKILQEALK